MHIIFPAADEPLSSAQSFFHFSARICKNHKNTLSFTGNNAKDMTVNDFDSIQSRMLATIVAQAQNVPAETSIEQTIPAGTALQNLRATLGSGLNAPMALKAVRDALSIP
jgi:hypothetical protein